MANRDKIREIYENSLLLRYLNHFAPKSFRIVWELYLKVRQLRYAGKQLPLHPTTPILQSRQWSMRKRLASLDTAPHILFFTFTGWSKNVIQDALLGQALQLRGAQVSYYTCGGPFPLCYIHNASSNVPPMPCGRCRAYADSGLNAFGFAPTMTKDVIDSHTRNRLKAIVDAVPNDHLTNFEVDGIKLGYYASVSARWFLLTNNIDDSIEMRERIRGFIYLGLLAYTAAQRLIEQAKPDKIVMFNGLHAPERMIQEVARRNGIPYICTERGYTVNSIYATHNMPCAGYPLDDLWQIFENTPLSDAQNNRLDTYLTQRRYGLNLMDNLWQEVREDELQLRAEVGLTPDRPLIVAFTNVQGDTAVIDRDLAYPDLRDWIDDLIALFRANQDADLVFRIHPAETRLKRYTPRQSLGEYIAEKHPDLPRNIKVIPSASTLSSYTLAGMADMIMVYTSTVGLETALSGKPTTVSAQVHYREKGFTLDVRKPDDLHQWIDRWRTGNLPPINLEAARRYAYLFFFRSSIPLDDLIEETTFGQMRLKIAGTNDLELGRSPLLDAICNSILTGAPFINPEA